MTTLPQDQNAFVAFFTEFIKRIGAPNPTFFNVLGWIGVAATFVGFLPVFFPTIAGAAAWPLVLKISGIVLAIVAQFPVKPAAQTATILPFTAKEDGVSKTA